MDVLVVDHALFHVEHGAGGSELEPLNAWRIVFLTESNDQRFTEPFKHIDQDGTAPGLFGDLHRTGSPPAVEAPMRSDSSYIRSTSSRVIAGVCRLTLP